MNITPEQFEKFWSLHRTGSQDDLRTVLDFHIYDLGPQDGVINGKPVTFDLIYHSYKNYLDGWKRTFGKRDPKYIANKDALIPPIKFLQEKMYRLSFEHFKTTRDIYLFKNLTNDEIEKIGKQAIRGEF